MCSMPNPIAPRDYRHRPARTWEAPRAYTTATSAATCSTLPIISYRGAGAGSARPRSAANAGWTTSDNPKASHNSAPFTVKTHRKTHRNSNIQLRI